MGQVADGLGSATATCVLTTDGLGSATVVQGGWVTSLLIADLGARKKWVNGAFLATDGLCATVVKGGAAVGQRGNAWGGSDI